MQAEPIVVLQFLLDALRRRLPAFVPDSFPITRLLNLQPLQREGWKAAMDIAASVLTQGLQTRPGGSEWEPYMREAFCLLMSHSDYPLPEDGVRALVSVLNPSNRVIVGDFIEARFCVDDPELYAHILRRMRASFAEYPAEDVVPAVFLIGRRCVCPPTEDRHWHHKYVADFMWEHRDFSCDAIWTVMLSILGDCVRNHKKLLAFVFESLRAIISSRLPPSAEAEVHSLISVLLRQGNTRYVMYRQVANLDGNKRAYGPELGMETFCTVYRQATDTSKPAPYVSAGGN